MKKLVTLSAFALLLSGCSLDIFSGDDDKKDSDKTTTKVEEFKGDLEALGLNPDEDKEIKDFIFYSREENEADDYAEEKFFEDFNREDSYSYTYADDSEEVFLVIKVQTFDYEDFNELFDAFIDMSKESWDDKNTDSKDLKENFSFGDDYKAYILSDSGIEGYAIVFHRKNVLVSLAIGSEDDSYEDYLGEVEDILKEIDSRIKENKELDGDDFAEDNFNFDDEDSDFGSVEYDAFDTQRIKSYDDSFSVEIPVALEYTGLDSYEYDGGKGSGVKFEISSDFDYDDEFGKINRSRCDDMADEFEIGLMSGSDSDLDLTKSTTGNVVDLDGIDACLVDASFEMQGYEFFSDTIFFANDSYIYTVQLLQTEDIYESDLIENIIDSAKL